jgi:PAS domain S-box-containing protein
MEYTREQLKALIDLMPGVAVMYIVQNGVVKPFLYSRAVPGFAGLTEKEYLDLYGENAMAVVLECDRPEMEKEMLRIFEQQESFSYNYRTCHKTKGFIWTHADAKLIGTHDGCPIIFSTFSEIGTDSRHNVPGGIVINLSEEEGDGSFYFIGQTLLKLLGGYTQNEFLLKTGGKFSGMIFSDDRVSAMNDIRRQLKNGNMDSCIFRMEKKDGSLVWVSCEGHIVTDRTGTPQHYSVISDITDTIRENEAFASRMQEFEQLIKYLPVGIVVQKISAGTISFVSANPSAYNVLRLSPDNISIRDQHLMARNIFPEDADYVYRTMRQLVFAGRHIDFAFRYLVGDGYRWIRMDAVTVARTAGDILVIAVLTDITSEKEAEANLKRRQLEERQKFHDSMQSLLAANQQSLCTFQLNLTANLCSDGFGTSPYIIQSLNADTADRLIDNISEKVPDGKERRTFLSLFKRTSLLKTFEEGKTHVSSVYRRFSEDNDLLWVRTTVNMVRNPLNGNTEAVLYSEDYEDRKNDEEIIQHITDEEFDFIATLSAATGSFCFRYVGKVLPAVYRNSYCEIGTSRKYEESIRYAANAWVIPGERDDFIRKAAPDEILKHLSAEERYIITISGKRTTGADCWKQIRFSWLNGMKKLILIEQVDITESVLKQQQELLNRLHMEQALRLEADKASEMKSRFLANVSHDMRTPLNAILGYDMLALKNADPDTVRTYLLKIRQAGSTLLSLVNDTLDLQKIEYGTTSLKTEPVLFDTIFDGILTAVMPMLDEKNIHLTISECCHRDVGIYADPMRFQEIFINLLSNCAKFTEPDGHVTLRAECIKETPDRLYGRITVSDDGIGISREFLPRIFEPFTQERTEKTAHIGGSGLGLSIVKRLVDMMNGRIEVTSELGKGTTFVIYLDFQKADIGKIEASQKKNSYHLEGLRILLCEDNEMNREIAKTILESNGMEVELAVNGKDGAEKMLASPKGYYNAIIMDIRMPIMDGYTAAVSIRKSAHPDAATVPIIAMTADACADGVQESRESGINAYISKPIDPDLLFSRLQDLVRDRSDGKMP